VDEHLFRIFYGAERGALTWLAAAFTVLGNGWIALALLPLLAWRRHRAPALALTLVLAVTAAAVFVLKLLVHRARPCNSLAGVQCLWGNPPTDFSFPSGHAAGSFAFVAFLGAVVFASAETRMRRTARLAVCLAGLLSATCIAASRVYLGVHFPGDVVAGSCLGAAIGLLGARAHLQKGTAKRSRCSESATDPTLT
jgi:undecaprenyl-diphosphatase